MGAAAALVALSLRWALGFFYGEATGFMILLPAVILAALAGGRVAGISAVAFCLAGGWALVSFAARDTGVIAPLGRITTVNFIVVGLFSAVVAASLRRTLRRLDSSLRELRDAETRLHLVSEEAPVMLWMTDADGRCIHLNAEQRAFWKAPLDLSEFDPLQCVHPDDRHRLQTEQRAAAAARRPYATEFRSRRRDGVWRRLRAEIRPRLDEQGGYLGMIGVNADVTEAREAEAALRVSEALFRSLADSAPSPVFMVSAAGALEFANRALQDFYGHPEAEMLGHVWRQALHPDDVVIPPHERARRKPEALPFAFEARFRRADGAWRWMTVSIRPRLDGDDRLAGYVGMAFDVTDSREALDALARQERRQSFLLALSDRLRNLTDADAIMSEVQRSLGDLLGVGRVGYGEVDLERGVVDMNRDWTDGLSSARGRFSLSDLGAHLIADLSHGETIRIADVQTDPRVEDARAVLTRLGARALLRAPLIRGGRLRAFLYIHHAQIRDWTDAEASLVEEVADRTWSEIERARAEAELRESEVRFRAIADTAPVLIWVTDAGGQRAFVNHAYAAFTGGDLEQSRVTDWRALIHPEDEARIVREAGEGERSLKPFSMEARYRRHDGAWRWLKSFSHPRLGSGGAVIGFVGVAFDVTDMREAQDRLQESESRFRTVADSAPALIFMTDADGVVNFANRRYRRFFSVRNERDLAEGWVRLAHKDDRAGFSMAVIEIIARQAPLESVVRVVHPRQGVRWLRCDALPRFDGAGVFQGHIGALIDVTDAKRAEDDLKRINELLAERVSEALAEKAQAEAELAHAQRLEAVGRLTGGVAHDFNNLLTVVIGALDMILRHPDDAARRDRLGQAALAAARRGERLTNQLLAFSRRQTLRPEAVDLNALIREGEPLLRRAVGEAADFVLDLNDGSADVMVDPAQFEAALLNLLVNARDAVGNSGRITVQTRRRRLKAGAAPDLPPGPYVCVTVSDNGPGIADDIRDRVFEPFFTTKSVGKGTGLGLSQVYGFARQSGGSVGLTSRPGRGTAISLYLPSHARRTAPAEVVSDGDAWRSQLADRRVLLVEDDPGVTAVAMELLAEVGLAVTPVDSAARALEALQIGRYDIMLSDVVMPGGMSGAELARICAARYPHIRIVLATGYAGDTAGALSDAPWPVLRKPYSAQDLRNALTNIR